MNKIPRKWQWISEKLEKLDYKELAGLAKRIDRLLTELYVDEHTEQWKRDYQEIETEYKNLTDYERLRMIERVAKKSAYCVACEESQNCMVCRFDEEGGGDVWNEFMTKLFEALDNYLVYKVASEVDSEKIELTVRDARKLMEIYYKVVYERQEELIDAASQYFEIPWRDLFDIIYYSLIELPNGKHVPTPIAMDWGYDYFGRLLSIPISEKIRDKDFFETGYFDEDWEPESSYKEKHKALRKLMDEERLDELRIILAKPRSFIYWGDNDDYDDYNDWFEVEEVTA